MEEEQGYRLPPSDIAAENSVVGALLLNDKAINDVIDFLKPEDFYNPKFKLIYEAELALNSDSSPIDAITVIDYLTKNGNIEKVGGALEIHDLVGGVVSTANVEYYAKIVHDKALLRRIITTGASIEQSGFVNDGSDIQDIINSAQEKIYNLSENAAATDYVSIYGGFEKTMEALKKARDKDGEVDGVPTGLTMLDNYLNGLKGGQMIVIAARPGVGKSVLSLDIARNAAIKNNIPTIIFNLEMAYPEIMMRLISAELAIDQGKMRKGELGDDEWQRIEQLDKRFISKDGVEVPLYLDDSPNMSMTQIRTKCRRLSSSDRGLGLIIIDYLQLMSSGQRVESRQQEVSDISRKLKLLAKELDVPVIAISQLNRGSEQRGDRTPQLSDLRESGAIEQDADVVILIHREEMYHKSDEGDDKARKGEADIIIAKNRAGRTGDFVVTAQMHLSRFKTLSQEFGEGYAPQSTSPYESAPARTTPTQPTAPTPVSDVPDAFMASGDFVPVDPSLMNDPYEGFGPADPGEEF
jgi:replicative DNA helicase